MSNLISSFRAAPDSSLPSMRSSPAASKCGDEQKASTSDGTRSRMHANVRSQDDSRIIRRKRVNGSKITKRVNAPTSFAKAKKADKWDWNIFNLLKYCERPQSHIGESLEGETLVEDDRPIKCEEEDEYDEETEGVVTTVEEDTFFEPIDGDTAGFTPSDDKAFQPGDERIQDWSEDELWTFNKLIMRGREPLLPYELASEFPSWPDILFSRNQDKVFISNNSRSTTNLASAFNRFLYEGISVRCRLQSTVNAEPPIERALKGFHKFILQDAHLRLKENPPLICTVAAATNEDSVHVAERCEQKMYRAGRQWRNWLLEQAVDSDDSMESPRFAARLPTIYGFVIKHSVLTIMTWDSSLGDEEGVAKPVRPIGSYDWKMTGQDVWHALAVGIVECKARNYLMDLDEQGLLGSDCSESDPDL